MDPDVEDILSGWVRKADENYVSGKFLFGPQLFTGGCVLLWLGFEQMCKSAILRRQIQQDPSLVDVMGSFSAKVAAIDTRGKDITGGKHGCEPLMTAAQSLISFSESEREIISVVSRFFNRRYARTGSDSIRIDKMNVFEACFFNVRKLAAFPHLKVGIDLVVFAHPSRS